MVAYCAATRRIAFGGKNGVIIVHELRTSKAQVTLFHYIKKKIADGECT